MNRISCIIALLYIIYLPEIALGQKKIGNQENVENKWQLHTDSVNAFEIELPGKLEENKNLIKPGAIPAGWVINTFNHFDILTGIFYMVSVSSPGNDNYIADDSLYLVSLRENLAKNLVNRTLDTIICSNGLCTYHQAGKVPLGNGTLRSKATVRRNRVVTIVAGSGKSEVNHPDISRFFGSFNLLEFKKAAFHTQTFAAGFYETTAPAPFLYALDTVSTEKPVATYNSRDSLSSDVFSVILMEVENKQWYRNAGEYWEEKLGLVNGDGDSLISQKPVSNGDAEGYQAIVQNGKLKKHIRMLPFSDSLLVLLTVAPMEEELSEYKQGFFEHFRFKNGYVKPAIFKSRAVELLADLTATDSAIYQVALAKMDDAPFSIADIPQLRKALMEHYPLAEYSRDYTLTPTEKIGDALLELGDPSLASYAMKTYGLTHGRNWLEQSLLLNIMAKVPKEETFRFVTNQLLSVPQDTLIAQDVFFTLCDDLDLLHEVFPDLLPLIENPLVQSGMLAVINNLLQSDSISPQTISKYEPLLIKLFKEDLEIYTGNSTAEQYNRHYRHMAIAGKLKSEAGIVLLEKGLDTYKAFLQLKAAMELLSAGKNPAPKYWNQMASEKVLRYDLYVDLKERERLDLFPEKYAKQNLMAESVLWTLANEDTDPIEINELTQRKTKKNGEAVIVYFFTIIVPMEDGNRTPRLGMAVFADDPKKPEILEDYFGIDWENLYLPKQKDKQIDKMMGWLDEW